MKRVSLFLLSVFAFLPVIAYAQNPSVQTGTPPFGSFSGGPVDIVNNANLNVHLNIPVLQKAGRGTPFSFSLTYDSSVWFPVTSGSTTSWQPVSDWGWGINTNDTVPMSGYITYSSKVVSTCYATIDGVRIEEGTGTEYYDYTFVDQLGTPHLFPGFTVWELGNPNYCVNEVNDFPGFTSTIVDGSGYTLTVEGGANGGPGAVSIATSNGAVIIPEGSSLGATTYTDRNGNQITNSGSTLTDTLGTTALTVSGSIPTVTYSYTAPNGNSASYTVNYTSYTVATDFDVSGIGEFGPTAVSLISSITRPDGSEYTFTYEETPGTCTPLSGTFTTNCVTGRIAKVTLPTGGTLSYAYSGGNNGILSDGSTATLTRTLSPGGTWTYAHSESGTDWTTTVTDPTSADDQTVYDFQGIYVTERQVYQGTAASGAQLEEDATCYNGNTSSCTTTAITLPITERNVTKTLGSEVCQHVYSYNDYGLLTEQEDYDYGSTSPGSLLRETSITYASLGNDIVGMPQTVTVENGSGVTVAKTTYQYDQTSLATPPGTTPSWVSISGARGNATTVSYFVSSSTTLSKTFTYYNTGNVDVATDVNNGTTTYNYSNDTLTCGNAFPTSVTEAVAGLSQLMTWNCTGGVETSMTDENDNTMSVTYNDPDFWRPTYATDQEGNQTNFTYSPTTTESSLIFNNSSSTADFLTTVDGLGRIHVTQKKQSPSSTTYDSVETSYDVVGRPVSGTVPYSGTSGETDSSAPATTQTYDALSRPLTTADGGGGTINLTYYSNDVLQALGPAPSGENPKKRQSQYNGIGQLTSVCEFTTTLPGYGRCGQTNSELGYWTEYTNDVLGDLLTVTQNAQSSTSTQSRTYTYDGLGRMLSEANPETGTINYVYDTDPTCGTSDGDLVKKTDAAGNVTCYTHDLLHRVTSITYPSGPNSGNTPNKCFVYNGVIDGETVKNAEARLAEAYTTTSACSQTTLPTTITDEAFGYTARGEVSDVYESTPHSSGYFHVNELYWANGALEQISDLTGLPTLAYAPDGEGRANTVSASSGQNPVTGTTYNVASEATQLTFGSTDSDAFTFDPNTFRMTQYQFNVNSQSVTGVLSWNKNGTLSSLAITDAFNAANTQTCLYGNPSASTPVAGYDDLGRLISGNCGSVWSQTFSYDAFGNITKTGSESFQPIYSPTTNQISSIGSFTPSYDANGNVLNDSSNTYAWDSLGRPTTIDGVTVTYDALGRMVEQDKSGSYTQIVYDPLGNKLALMNTTTTLTEAFGPLPAGGTAVYTSSSLGTANKVAYYRHPDWMGSSRFSSTPTRTLYNDLAYAPFGEQYAASGTTGVTNTSFGGNNEDTTTNLYDAYFREYGIQGRWPSPDPAGMAVANPGNPQSWNRYAYALNNPLLFTDPSGLDGCVNAATCTILIPDDGDPIPPGGMLGIGGDGGLGHIAPFIGPGGPGGPGSDGCVVGPCGPPPPVNPLAYCVSSLYGVTLISYSPSAPGVNGSFTGSYDGNQFTVYNNDTIYSQSALTQSYISAGYSVPAGYSVGGLTIKGMPYVNLTAYDQQSFADFANTQTWELGNSLAVITNSVPANVNTSPGAANTEPGSFLLNCANGGGSS